MAGILAKSYADALYELAQDEKQLLRFKDQLKKMDQLMDENASFYQILTHPKIHKTEKKQSLETVCKSFLDHTVLNFLKLLIDKGRFQKLHEITKEMEHRYYDEHNIVIADVRSAKALDTSERDRLKEMLEKKLAKTVDMRCHVDETLIAGLRIKINDLVLDNSALKRIDQLKTLAKSTEYTKARGECE